MTRPDIDAELASQITVAVLHREIIKVVPIMGKGSVNIIFLVRTDGLDVIVRMSKPEDHHRGEQFYKKEQWCLNKAAELGIPGPAVLDIGQWDGRIDPLGD